MRIMSLQQFVQQASEPQDPATQEVLTMDVRHFLDAITTNYEDDCVAEVTLNSPDPDSISVKFFPLEDEAGH
jgi:hypothetical protein